MLKSDLVKAIASQSGVSQEKAFRMLEVFAEEVTGALVHEEKVTIKGFGSFTVTEKAARPGRNPQTEETIEIPSHKAVRFTLARGIKAQLN